MQITKFRSELFIAVEQATVHLERIQNTLTRLGKSIAEKPRRLQEAIRVRENGLRKLLANSLHAIVVFNSKTTKFRSELFIALEQMTVHVQRAQNTLTSLGKSIAEKPRRLQEAIRVRENGLRKLLASSLHAIVVFNGKTTKFRSELFIALEQVTVHVQRAQNRLTSLGRSVAQEPRRLQEALRVRENGLQKLLASSLDAVVVTNGDRRFVAANPKALDLLGISEANMRQFTIDAFLPHGQILDFDGAGPPFMRRQERRGKCKIRRLDGSLRVAEYIFVANFAPLRHLSRFRDVTPEKVQVKFIAKFNSGHGDIQVPAS